jgi:hypothetical protein
LLTSLHASKGQLHKKRPGTVRRADSANTDSVCRCRSFLHVRIFQKRAGVIVPVGARPSRKRGINRPAYPSLHILRRRCQSFFIRPRPVISYVKLREPHKPQDTIEINGVSLTLFRTDSVELWINVRNDGETTIKSMRAR